MRRSLGPGKSSSVGDKMVARESAESTLIARDAVFTVRFLGDSESVRWTNHLNFSVWYAQITSLFGFRKEIEARL